MGPRVDGASVGPTFDTGSGQHSSNATVQVGETSLGQVANRLGVDADELLMANPQIKDPWKLQAGQDVHMPVGSTAPAVTPLNNPTAVRQAFASPTAGGVDAKSMAEMKMRETTMHSLIEQGMKAGFSQPEMIRMINTMVPLTSSEFNKWSAKMQSAFNAGDRIGALRTIGLADAAHQAVAKSGGGQAIQADVVSKADGIHFDFDRPVSQQQAANLIFQGGKVPEGASLVQGPGNSWVVQRPNDLDSQQSVVSHLKSHMETVDNMHPGQSTFTWVMNPAHAMPPVSHRKDIDNDFGFKIRKNFPLDQGDIRAEQLRSMIGKGFGYELQFDKPMTKDEVMDKLFEKGANFNKADVKLQAVPSEPSNVYEVKIVGPDALTSIKGKYVPAFADSVIYNKPSLSPDLPSGLKGQFENHTIPPNAKKLSSDTYMWEKDGYIAYVKSDGKNFYEPQATKMPNDPALKKTIQYFMEQKGMPPREAWQAFDKHWDELDRMMIMAMMNFYAAAGGAVGGRPQPEGEFGALKGSKVGTRVRDGLENDATTEIRGVKGSGALEKTEQETGLAKIEETEAGATTGAKGAQKGSGAGDGGGGVPGEGTGGVGKKDDRPRYHGTSEGDIAIDPDKGLARELRVAEEVKGKITKQAKTDGVLKTATGETSKIDVWGPNGEAIVVGGPAKAKSPAKLGSDLKRLKQAADDNGRKAMAYFEEGTPQSVLDLAAKFLGKENVKVFK